MMISLVFDISHLCTYLSTIQISYLGFFFFHTVHADLANRHTDSTTLQWYFQHYSG